MKLKYAFEPVDMGDEIVIVPVGKEASQVHGIFKCNQESLEILKLLINDITEEQILDTLAAKYENDRATLAAYVRSFIENLRKTNVLQD